MTLNQRAAQLADWIMTEDMTKFPPDALLASVKLFFMEQRHATLEEAARYLEVGEWFIAPDGVRSLMDREEETP